MAFSTKVKACFKNSSVVLLGVLCFVSPLLLIFSIQYLVEGYHNPNLKAAKGATPNDFISFGNKCRIEGIDYRAITESRVVKTDSGTKRVYSCAEKWQYDFVVLEYEGVLDAEVDADYFGLRSVTEQRPACDRTGCGDCDHCLGRYALDDGQPIKNGYFVTECWTLKDGVAAHPFWNCSQTTIVNDTACYLVSDPIEILNAHLNTPRREIMIGWILFAPVALLVAITCMPCVWARAKS